MICSTQKNRIEELVEGGYARDAELTYFKCVDGRDEGSCEGDGFVERMGVVSTIEGLKREVGMLRGELESARSRRVVRAGDTDADDDVIMRATDQVASEIVRKSILQEEFERKSGEGFSDEEEEEDEEEKEDIDDVVSESQVSGTLARRSATVVLTRISPVSPPPSSLPPPPHTQHAPPGSPRGDYERAFGRA